MTKEELAHEHHFIQTGLSVGKNQSHADLTFECAKQQAIAFAEWLGDSSWRKHPEQDNIWYIPSEDFDTPPEEKTTEQLYTLFLTHQSI